MVAMFRKLQNHMSSPKGDLSGCPSPVGGPQGALQQPADHGPTVTVSDSKA